MSDALLQFSQFWVGRAVNAATYQQIQSAIAQTAFQPKFGGGLPDRQCSQVGVPQAELNDYQRVLVEGRCEIPENVLKMLCIAFSLPSSPWIWGALHESLSTST